MKYQDINEGGYGENYYHVQVSVGGIATPKFLGVFAYSMEDALEAMCDYLAEQGWWGMFTFLTRQDFFDKAQELGCHPEDEEVWEELTADHYVVSHSTYTHMKGCPEGFPMIPSENLHCVQVEHK